MAVPDDQHSKRFGHFADEHTVSRLSSAIRPAVSPCPPPSPRFCRNQGGSLLDVSIDDSSAEEQALCSTVFEVLSIGNRLTVLGKLASFFDTEITSSTLSYSITRSCFSILEYRRSRLNGDVSASKCIYHRPHNRRPNILQTHLTANFSLH